MNYHNFVAEIALRDQRPALLLRCPHWDELNGGQKVMVDAACINYGRHITNGLLIDNLDDM